jgi:dTDP-4-dehydrorhamnose 3,5-epimerase
MEIKSLGIHGAWICRSNVHSDDRGEFQEWFKQHEILSNTGFGFSVTQANLSHSRFGVVRGIHYSLASEGQAKWVTCVAGSIQDVVLDIRTSSPTFGKHVSVKLEAGSGDAILIEPYLGHGFISLVENSIVAYLVSSPYSPSEEFEINPMDPELGIDWGLPTEKLVISKKDRAAPSLIQRKNQGNIPS